MTKQKAATPAKQVVKPKASLPDKKMSTQARAASSARAGRRIAQIERVGNDQVVVVEVPAPKVKITPTSKIMITPTRQDSPGLEYKRVGTRMRARRVAQGMSLNRTAQKIGCTATTLKRWEEGDIKSIKHTRLEDIARALNTTEEDLLGLENYTTELPGVSSVASNSIFPAGVKADYEYTMPDDSMINARIFKGDRVYIKRSKSDDEIKNGDIALIEANGDTLLRRVYQFKGYLDLRPENPTHEPTTFEGLEQTGVRIVGKAVAFLAKI